jgi:small-conductance mechanosensitive channel
MPDTDTLGSIFNSLDASVFWELGWIILSAFALILIIRRFLPWFASHLSGKRRLFVLSIAPYVRLFVVFSALIMAIPLLIEPSLQNMVAILGSLGLAVGFALKDYASGLIAGIVAISEFNYRNGDWVQMGEVYGEVRHIGLRTVEIVTPDDNRVLVPHNHLWTEAVFNANNGDARLQCSADFYLHPLHDAEKVRDVLEKVALTSPYLYFDKPVAVVARELPRYTHYRLKAYPVDARQQFRFTTDLTIRGKAALLDLGVSFPSGYAIPAEHQ